MVLLGRDDGWKCVDDGLLRRLGGWVLGLEVLSPSSRIRRQVASRIGSCCLRA